MFLQSLSSCVPKAAYSQQACWEIFKRSEAAGRIRERSVNLVGKILLSDNGIDKRHFALKDIDHIFDLGPEELNREFESEAPQLAGRSLKLALERAQLLPGDLDALFVCTCTGYLCPGLSSYVSEQTGLRRDTYLQDIVGLGCGASIPTLRSASNFLQAQKSANVAVIAVELCSTVFYIDDDPGVLISLCLFGDGAAASIWSMDSRASGLWCDRFDTVHLPEIRDLLRFENRMGKLRNRLHRTVSEKAGEAVNLLYSRLNGTKVGAVISHGGGRDVIEAVEEVLPGHRLEDARQVLRNFGNMSSPSLLFALDQHLNCPGPSDDLWLTTFGAGFACHSCSIQRR